jgi:hypothetical protein
MDPARILQVLVIAEVLLTGSSILFSFFEPDVPEPVETWLNAEAAGPLMKVLDSGEWSLRLAIGALMLVLLGVYLTAIAGLLTFRNWARPLYIAATLGGLVILPSMGYSLASPTAMLLSTASNMVTGTIMAMLLFVPAVRERFRAPAAPPPGTAAPDVPS